MVAVHYKTSASILTNTIKVVIYSCVHECVCKDHDSGFLHNFHKGFGNLFQIRTKISVIIFIEFYSIVQFLW